MSYEKGKYKSNDIITLAISVAIKEQLPSPTSAFISYIDLQQWQQEKVIKRKIKSKHNFLIFLDSVVEAIVTKQQPNEYKILFL